MVKSSGNAHIAIDKAFTSINTQGALKRKRVEGERLMNAEEEEDYGEEEEEIEQVREKDGELFNFLQSWELEK